MRTLHPKRRRDHLGHATCFKRARCRPGLMLKAGPTFCIYPILNIKKFHIFSVSNVWIHLYSFFIPSIFEKLLQSFIINNNSSSKTLMILKEPGFGLGPTCLQPSRRGVMDKGLTDRDSLVQRVTCSVGARQMCLAGRACSTSPVAVLCCLPVCLVSTLKMSAACICQT